MAKSAFCQITLIVFASILFYLHVKAGFPGDTKLYDEWYDHPEEWENEMSRDGWNWDDLEVVENHTLKSHLSFPKSLRKLQQYHEEHFEQLASTNPFYPDEKYEELVRDILQVSESFVIKLDLYGDLMNRLYTGDWVMDFHFVPFSTPEPQKNVAEKDWLLGPARMVMFAKNELLAKISHKRKWNPPGSVPTKLCVSQLITVNPTSISVLTRHLARYEYNFDKFLMPMVARTEEADVTKVPWSKIQELRGVDPRIKELKNIFQYPGPPSESDIFDLMVRKENGIWKDFGTKVTATEWLANQFLRTGQLRKSQKVWKSWEFMGAQAEAEFMGCDCMNPKWKMQRDPVDSIDQSVRLVKECRKEAYKQWKRLAVTARLSSCLVEDPQTYGMVYENIPSL